MTAGRCRFGWIPVSAEHNGTTQYDAGHGRW